MKEEDFDFALNEAAIYFEDKELKVSYGEGHVLSVELPDSTKTAVKQVLATGDFWTAFLGALSNAADKVKNGT